MNDMTEKWISDTYRLIVPEGKTDKKSNSKYSISNFVKNSLFFFDEIGKKIGLPNSTYKTRINKVMNLLEKSDISHLEKLEKEISRQKKAIFEMKQGRIARVHELKAKIEKAEEDAEFKINHLKNNVENNEVLCLTCYGDVILKNKDLNGDYSFILVSQFVGMQYIQNLDKSGLKYFYQLSIDGKLFYIDNITEDGCLFVGGKLIEDFSMSLNRKKNRVEVYYD